MAVNRIRYRDGRKICIPIQNKAEYLALRDSDFNRECVELARKGDKRAKAQLEQFNYSLTTPSCPSGILPRDGEEGLAQNREFPLKGANCVGNSVGMDIDLCVPEQLPEGVTKEKWIEDEILNISKNILDKKEEIGLLMCERSATKGLHIVFRRDVSLDQEGNLKRVSDVLGVPFDEAAKDITRVFFTPTSADILYIAEGLFDRAPIPSPSPARGKGVDRKYPSLTEGSQKKVTTPFPRAGEGSGLGAECAKLIAPFGHTFSQLPQSTHRA